MTNVEDSRKRNSNQRQNSTPRNGSNQPSQQTNRKGNVRNNQPVNKPLTSNTSNNTTNSRSTPPPPSSQSITAVNPPSSTSTPPPQRKPPQEDRISTPTPTSASSTLTPIPTYNTTEVEELLKRGFDLKAQQYKPNTEQTNTQNNNNKSSVWAAKPGTMSNGKDFWLELRKQVGYLKSSRQQRDSKVDGGKGG